MSHPTCPPQHLHAQAELRTSLEAQAAELQEAAAAHAAAMEAKSADLQALSEAKVSGCRCWEQGGVCG